ncbi:DNA-3-methyladenine glycosylase I [Acaryochloris sp. IP29b_bin.137]|uniref:DNA-3-methyladenine glycosylase I n=1 Tax=Acaryochloris sp. IP29b_bin.137 TaxID=2969217 RepID=UPI00261A6D34|nr:DNA-3-methyladenine glycosylase I [Acaryochloris sp. IP29b_bin.137]
MTSSEPICRCSWVDLSKPDYVLYHDQEWGIPVYDDQHLFEHLVLESSQAGLSWYTVLRKRENYRAAFEQFNPQQIAHYDEAKIETLMGNAGIIRNRKKIEAIIGNARAFLQIQAEFGSFASYSWRFVDGQPIVNAFSESDSWPTTSPESDAMSKDLRQRGFKFFGSTICYAHMQATGMVNDHSVTCFRRQEIINGYASNPVFE